jgi:hypothetical protein
LIYFLQPDGGGPIKIGYSDDVERRHREVEVHYGCPFTILATIEGDLIRERQIHFRFARHRFGNTEQFRPGAEILEFLGRPALDPAFVAAVEPLAEPERRRSPPNRPRAAAGAAENWAVRFRGSPEYLEWLSGLADAARAQGVEIATNNDVAIHAIAAFAARISYPPSPSPARKPGRPKNGTGVPRPAPIEQS